MDNSQFQIFLQLIWCRHRCNFRFFITPLDSQKNSASDSSTRFVNFGSELVTNEVQNYFVYSHFSLTSSVTSDSIVPTCYELIDSTCDIY